MSRSAIRDMEVVVPGLHASSPQPLPFDASLEIRAFLLEREPGNVLVYSSEGLERDAAALEALGGAERHYLNHWHEAIFADTRAREALGASLLCHEADADQVRERVEVAHTFSRRHRLDGDFEAIPIPGHTPGATAYLWDTGAHRALFTGDSVYLRDEEWVGALLDSSDRAAYIASLELLAGLDFDLLVPWAASAGSLPYAVTGRADATRRLGEIADRLRRGADH